MRNVAIIGRPNVGKSALFNRLAGRQISIVHDQPGVTRDRIGSICNLGQAPFEITDTGGIGSEPDPDFAESTREGAFIAMGSADVILFVTDSIDGVTPLDGELSSMIRTVARQVVLVVNKVDTEGHESRSFEFSRLGFKNLVTVSAAHGRGIGELVDVIESLLPEPEPELETHEMPPLKLALIGRPNVGKSSLVNQILNDNRTTVSDIAGTTRDTIDVEAEYEKQRYILCDTAGIRHRSRHNTSVEVFSVMRSEKTIRRVDINILVIDATSGVTAQDKKIAGLIQKAKKPAIIVLNKWDLIEKQTNNDPDLLREHVDRAMAELFFLDYAPVVILSALTGENIRRLFTMVEKVRQHATRRAGTGELNRVLRAAMERQAPPSRGSRRFKLLYAAQAKESSNSEIAPPLFVLFVNDPRLLPESYQNYLCARIRDQWEYPGLPILMRLRGREGVTQDINE
ncbi:MAG: ribosome biogenesis GTPase Der [Verrucomicrobia bacterium]|nr:ribosome biogenesis GTPase Der [Verrucomicrobiota bacterium]